MTPVESILSTSLVAVPAFMRVDPVRISGPVTGVMAISATRAIAESGTQVSAMVRAPRLCAKSSAPST